MSRAFDTWLKLELCAGLALAGTLGCVCPPCEGAQSPDGVSTVPSGSRFIIWDGDGGGISGGKSWADCDKKPDCKASAAMARKKGREKSSGLLFHAKGPAWNGFGWNWYGWWPEDAGTDISGYDDLVFWMRVEAESEDKAPVPGGMTVSLRCSKGKKTSNSVEVAKFAKNFTDGEWHKITIPLKEFYKGKEGAEFDPRSAWEFGMGTWSPSPRNFNIYFDDIAVEKR